MAHGVVVAMTEIRQFAARRRWCANALALALLVVGVTAACSPEATRTRAGGPGADVGNRDYPLPLIHGDASNPSYQTPKVGQAIQK
jgi:hypothetical protein